MFKMNKIKCDVCGKKYYPNEMNGILRDGLDTHYCQKKECQEIFIERAGDRPSGEERE